MPIIVVNKYIHAETPNDVYVGRGSALGNPYTHRPLHNTKAQFQCVSRDEAIASYKPYLNEKIMQQDPAVVDALNAICEKAKDELVYLVCFCRPQSCHAEYIKEVCDAVIEHRKNQ